MTSTSVDKKIVLITGANKGIGFATAKGLATEYNEYHVLLGSRDQKRGTDAAAELQKNGLSVEAITIDVTDDKSIEAAAQTIREKFGRLDILINNAGISNTAMTRSAWQSLFSVNLFGAMATTEAFLPLLKQSPAARLVFVSSDLGSCSFLSDPAGRHNAVEAAAYRCSKAALNMLTLHYANVYRTQGWKVNAHNPEYTASDLNGWTGPGTLEDAAKNAIRLAMLGEEGETGTFSEKGGVIPW